MVDGWLDRVSMPSNLTWNGSDMTHTNVGKAIGWIEILCLIFWGLDSNQPTQNDRCEKVIAEAETSFGWRLDW